MITETIPLRIVVVEPPPAVRWAVQLGRDGLLPPAHVAPGAVTFDFTLVLAAGRDGRPTLRGPAAQGPPAERFVYVNSGRGAGDEASPWSRRAKVSLAGITPALLRDLQARPDGVLEARFLGTDRRGGPACATVPLQGGGWRVD